MNAPLPGPVPSPTRVATAARWLAVGLGFCLASGSAQSVRVTGISPGTLQPGVTNLVLLAGENLAPGQTILTSAGVESAPGRPVTGGVEFPLPLPANSPEGILVVRVQGPQGISAPLLLAVDRLPTLARYPAATNASLARLPAAVEGRNPGNATNRFGFPLRRGESIQLEVLARRLGGTLDPWVSILGPDGRPVVVCEDSPGLQGDVAVRFTARQSGRHEMVLRDSDFDGGARGGFRLRATRGSPGSRDMAAPLGFIELPEHAPGVTSGEAYPLLRSPEKTSPTQPGRLPIPSRIRGTLPEEGGRLILEFSVDRPRSLRAAFLSRDLGSLGDVAAVFEDTAGRPLAELDSTRSDDGAFQHDFTKPGTYRLVLWELSGAGGRAFPFECQFGPGGGDVQITTDQHTLELAPGGRVSLQVNATRRGHDGPVELRVAGLPADWPECRATLPAKAKEATLELRVPASAAVGKSHLISVLGEFPSPDAARVLRASNRAALRKIWPDLLTPPPSLDGTICVGVISAPGSDSRQPAGGASTTGAQAGLRP